MQGLFYLPIFSEQFTHNIRKYFFWKLDSKIRDLTFEDIHDILTTRHEEFCQSQHLSDSQDGDFVLLFFM